MRLDLEFLDSNDISISATRVGIEDMERFSSWIARGYQGSMNYLSRDDALMRRGDTSLLVSHSKSVILFLLNYKHAVEVKDGYGRIASYATFRDYHEFIPELIDRFMTENRFYLESFKTFVDTGPLIERSVARKSSLGWIGKSSMLVSPRLGSFTFIGAAITDLHVDNYPIPVPDLCGNCTRCVDSCPTNAINIDRTVNSNLCISYHTIESRKTIPVEISSRMGDMIFGCDICNDVCPWNRDREESSLPETGDNTYSNRMKLEDIAYIDREQFNEKFRGSAIRRATSEGLARNSLIALYNSGREDIVREAARDLEDLRRDQAFLLLEKKVRMPL